MTNLERRTAVFDLEMALRHMPYDDMINFADSVYHECGVFIDGELDPRAADVTVEDFARAIRGYATLLEGVRTAR